MSEKGDEQRETGPLDDRENPGAEPGHHAAGLWQKPVTVFFLILFLLIVLLLYRLFNPFFNMFILSAILAGLYLPIYRFLLEKYRQRRVAASLTTCVVVFLTVFVPLIYFVLALSNEAYALYQDLTDMVYDGKIQQFVASHKGHLEDLLERLNRLHIKVQPENLEKNVAEIGRSVALMVYQQATAFISNTAKLILNFLFLLLTLFYLFIDGPKLRDFFFSLSPLPDDHDRFLAEKFNGMARAVLYVNGLGGLIQGILGGLGFWLFGLPAPLLWGSLMAVLAFLPLVGISIVFVPAAAFLVITKKYLVATLFATYFVLLSASVEYVLKPRLVGQQAKMHTLVVLLSIIGGLRAFGILGILYGPLIVTGFFSLVELYHKTYEKVLLGEDAGA